MQELPAYNPTNYDRSWNPKHLCRRCGRTIGAQITWCTTCQSIMKRANKDQTGFLKPSFEVTVYSTEDSRGDTGHTVHTLRATKLSYVRSNLRADAVAAAYAIEHVGHMPKCWVTISRPGVLLDSWEGYRTDKLAEWTVTAEHEAMETAA